MSIWILNASSTTNDVFCVLITIAFVEDCITQCLSCRAYPNTSRFKTKKNYIYWKPITIYDYLLLPTNFPKTLWNLSFVYDDLLWIWSVLVLSFSLSLRTRLKVSKSVFELGHVLYVFFCYCVYSVVESVSQSITKPHK